MKHYEDIEADDCYDMAVEWIRHGNYDKAVSYFTRAIELNEYFIYAYIALARTYATQQNYADAIHMLKKASHLDPAFDRLHYLMAKYAYKNGDFKNALICITRAIEMDGKDLYEEARKIIEAQYHRG